MNKFFMLILLVIAIIAVVSIATGCASPTATKSGTPAATASGGTYQKIAPAAVKERLDKGEKLIIIDVRTQDEYNSGHIAKSLLLPYDEIEKKAANLLTDKSAAIIVYCRSGNRSKIAAETLIKLGYTNVADMGGISGWTYGLEK